MQDPRTSPNSDPAFKAICLNFEEFIADLESDLHDVGKALFDRISTKNWYLEWILPVWLGKAHRLPSPAVKVLTLGNVFGLAYVRLFDDDLDGELVMEREKKVFLGKALYNQWLDSYRLFFDLYSPFWMYMDQALGQWLRAEMEFGGPDDQALRAAQVELKELEKSLQTIEADSVPIPPEPVLQLARRGAPLKICCQAASLLSGQTELLPSLLNAIDFYLAGAVLVDHADDWQEDIRLGRYNALVSYLIPGEYQKRTWKISLAQMEKIRNKVLEDLYLGDEGNDYFEFAQLQFRFTRFCISGLDINEFEQYLEWVVSRTGIYQSRLNFETKLRLRQAVNQIFC